MAITVHRATKKDQQDVGELWQALLDQQAGLDARFGPSEDARKRWDNDFPVWIRQESRRIFVAAKDEKVVGFLTAHRWAAPPIYQYAEEVYVDELYVLPEVRSEGVGQALVAAVKAWADELGAQRIRVGVLAANEAGRAFWEAMEARPFSMTYTMERTAEPPDFSPRRRIGF